MESDMLIPQFNTLEDIENFIDNSDDAFYAPLVKVIFEPYKEDIEELDEYEVVEDVNQQLILEEDIIRQSYRWDDEVYEV
jgi:hypothetical protein